VKSQTAHTKYKWPPYDNEPKPPHENFLRTPLDVTEKLFVELMHAGFAEKCELSVATLSTQ